VYFPFRKFEIKRVHCKNLEVSPRRHEVTKFPFHYARVPVSLWFDFRLFAVESSKAMPLPISIFVAVENFLPLHCEPPQAAKQSPYRPGDCFATLAMTGDRGFFMAFGRLAANFLNERIPYRKAWYNNQSFPPSLIPNRSSKTMFDAPIYICVQNTAFRIVIGISIQTQYSIMSLLQKLTTEHTERTERVRFMNKRIIF
jgi:hypothetical protein